MSGLKSWTEFLVTCVKYCSGSLKSIAVAMIVVSTSLILTGSFVAAMCCYAAAIVVVISSGVDRHAQEILEQNKVVVEQNKAVVEQNQRVSESLRRVYAEITATDDDRWVQWWREHHV